MDNLLIGLGGLILAVLIYFAGVQRWKTSDRKRKDFEEDREEDRRLNAAQLKAVDEYVQMVRSHPPQATGPHALACLGLELLQSDERIRAAILEMKAWTGDDPWGRQARHVEGVDLALFFRCVSEQGIDFQHTDVQQAVKLCGLDDENQVQVTDGSEEG